MLGEVWLMSGQSNMEMSAAWGIKDGDAEMAKPIIQISDFLPLENLRQNFHERYYRKLGNLHSRNS
jgi:hypothetical protein